MAQSWGVIGCAYMAREYCKVLLAKGVVPQVYSRNLTSTNVTEFKQAFPQLHVKTLEQIGPDVDHWLVCTNIESHAEICSKLPGEVYCEKPYAHDASYDADCHVSLLMNRRYYFWVLEMRGRIERGEIHKVVASIPEKSADALITQSIHVIDLLWYLCGPFEPASRVGLACPTYTLLAKRGLPVVINMNYGAHENFSVRFYAQGGVVYEARPVEAFGISKGMEVREPDDELPIRTYRPLIHAVPYEATGYKPGLGELIDDLIGGKPSRLPTLAEHRDIHAWMERNML
ncbi:MAG: hypothetical protein AB8G17_17435 [Gammaproteobacteria bacterium]